MLRQLRVTSIIEATSYLALIVATIVKQTGGGATGVAVLGPVHGVAYLVFVATIAARRAGLGWAWQRAVTAMIIGSLPLGGFWLERTWFAPLARAESGATVGG